MSKDVIIHGVTYYGKAKIKVPLANDDGYATFYDTSGADATASDILSGKSAFGPEGSVSGSIQNNGNVSGSIFTKAGSVSVPAGYTTGGSVTIDSTEQGKIIPSNIKAGVTILGVAGASNVVDTATMGSESAASAGDIMSGKTAFVNGAKLTGTQIPITVEQDNVTNILSIL